jgi:hypothetical protein
MSIYPTFLFLLFMLFPLAADKSYLTDVKLEDYQWHNRLVLVFAHSADDESYLQQISELNSDVNGLAERDIIIFSLFQNGLSRTGNDEISNESAMRIINRYNPDQHEFKFVLIGKDGGVKLKQDTMVSLPELFERIDRMPMRKQEMIEQQLQTIKE